MTLINQTLFESFISKNISLSPSQISQGSTSHNYIRELLGNKWKYDSSFPILTDGDFLSGSYARGTKIHPLNDIDVMIVIDGSGLCAHKEGIILNARVKGNNLEKNPIMQHLGENGFLSSKTVLGIFKKALNESHPDSNIRKNGQAINVMLGSGIGIDVVPCFHIIPNDRSQDFYYIPDGTTDGWLATNPKIDEKISTELHNHHNKKLKDIIRLIKYWNKIFNNNKLRSYHIEAVAWYIFSEYPEKITRYDDALKYFFNNATKFLSNQCPDPTQLGKSIDLYLTQIDRKKTIENVGTTKGILNNAFMLGLGTEQRQIESWHKVFGNDFGN